VSVIDFKKYLASNGRYSGTINSELDESFMLAMRKLEYDLSDMLSKVGMVSDNVLVGMILTKSGEIKTSVADIEASFNLIKKAQATVDTFDVEEFQTQTPIATKTVPTRDDTGIETGDPLDTQQIGKLEQKLPKKLPEEHSPLSMDERILELVDMIPEEIV